jgi:hypothetical protein
VEGVTLAPVEAWAIGAEATLPTDAKRTRPEARPASLARLMTSVYTFPLEMRAAR